ncbi:MAG: PAS domain S-box protein, partial [Proteobacteria bacterium]
MDRYLELLQNALDAVVGIDVDQRIIFWNYQAEQTFGWKSGEVLGKDMAMIIVPEGFRDGHRRGMAHYLETGEGPILNRRIEVPALKKDGTQFSCELTVTVMKQE